MTSKYIEAVYQYIITFKVDHDGNSPTIREIMRGCGVSSTSMVNIYLDCLVDDGRIEMINQGTNVRRIKVKGGSWRIYDKHTNIS